MLSAIDVEEFHVAGRKAAEERFARGEYGERLDDVLAELDAEDKPDSPGA